MTKRSRRKFNSYSRGNSTPNHYLYNGKEKQDELGLGWLDYGMRMYQPEIGRFFTQDRFAEKYMDFTPYQYGANNSVLFINVNGDSVNVAEMDRKDRKQLRKDLEAKTGLKIQTKKGYFQYKKNSNGQAKLKSTEGTSEKAREILMYAIDNEKETITVASGDPSQNVEHTNSFQLSSSEISTVMGEASEGLEKTTMGWALTFFHEYFHPEMGGSLEDPDPRNETNGPGRVVTRVNEIRAELGDGYGQREKLWWICFQFWWRTDDSESQSLGTQTSGKQTENSETKDGV